MKKSKTIMKRNTRKYAGFTLLEMLLVIFIIAVLILLFVPNLSKHKDSANEKGDEALKQVIRTQTELYQMEKGGTAPTLAQLKEGKYITKDQFEKAQKIDLTEE